MGTSVVYRHLVYFGKLLAETGFLQDGFKVALKMQDMKMTDQLARRENARLGIAICEKARHKNTGCESAGRKNARHDRNQCYTLLFTSVT